MRLQMQKQYIPDRITAVHKIIFCATSSSPGNSGGRAFLLSQSSRRQKKTKQKIMAVANFKEILPGRKRTPGLVSLHQSPWGDIPIHINHHLS